MARYLAKIAVMGAQVVGRAFARALRQEMSAAQAAAQNRQSNEPSSGPKVNSNSSDLDLKLGISLEEAVKILNIDAKLNPDEIQRQYDHLFSVNEKSKGGSFYLQSKVYRAKERIDEEIKRNKET